MTQPVIHVSQPDRLRSYAAVARANITPYQLPRVRRDSCTPDEHGTVTLQQVPIQRGHAPDNYASVTPGFLAAPEYSHQNVVSHGRIVNEISEALAYVLRLRRQGPQPPNQYPGHSGL